MVYYCYSANKLKVTDREILDEKLDIFCGEPFDFEGKLSKSILLLMKERIIRNYSDYCFTTRDEPRRIK